MTPRTIGIEEEFLSICSSQSRLLRVCDVHYGFVASSLAIKVRVEIIGEGPNSSAIRLD